MSFTPPVTFLTGDVLDAVDVQGSNDAFRLYVSHLPTSAIRTDKWIDSKHIVRGEYDPVTNTARYVSGLFAGVRGIPDLDYTYATVYNTEQGGSGVWEYMPGTCITLDVRRPITAIINWWMTTKGADNLSAGAAGITDIRLWTGSKAIRSGAPNIVTEEDSTVALSRKYRQTPGGFHIQDFTIGTFALGLACQSSTSKAFGLAWGMSVEARAL